MRRIILILYALCAVASMYAVTQQGNVRTIARKAKAGVPVEGTVVRVRGSHNAVQSRENGDFALLLANLQNGEPFAISSIVKAGYEPAEQELIGRRMPCSDQVPLVLLLVKSADLQAEKEAIAAKARENVEMYYEQRLAVLESELAAKKLTEAEYNRRLDELEGQYERFEPLLQAMSDKLARTDYSRMDSLTTLIQNAIESGNPEEAERLVREKGNLEAREAAIREQEAQIAKAQQTLDEAQTQLDKQRALTAQQKRELAEDYFRMYSAFLSRFQNDSAALYIRKRAELDTTNIDYQLQAGQFIKEMMANYPLAQSYFERAYRIALAQYGEQSGQMATTCHELGGICKVQGRLDESLTWNNRSLAIREKLFGKKSVQVAQALNNLGELYHARKDLKQAMSCHQRALKIREKSCGTQSYEVAETKNNIAGVYFHQNQLKQAEEWFNAAKNIYSQRPNTPPRLLAINYTNLGGVCYRLGKYNDAYSCFEQALAIYTKVLGASHPQTRELEQMLQLTKKKLTL